MTRELNLNDIQGNVTRAYGRFSFPFARYYFFHIDDAAAGRKFIDEVRKLVTTGERWTPDPKKGEDPIPGELQTARHHKHGVYLPWVVGAGTAGAHAARYARCVCRRHESARLCVGRPRPTITEEEAAKVNWDAHWDPIWQKNRVPGGGWQRRCTHLGVIERAMCAGHNRPCRRTGPGARNTSKACWAMACVCWKATAKMAQAIAKRHPPCSRTLAG